MLTGPDGDADKWLVDIEYISVFEVTAFKPSRAVLNKLANTWERIYQGLPADLKGGYKRKAS